MALFHHQDTLRLLPGGAGQNGVTVTFKLEADGSTLGTAVTDGNGLYQKSLSTTATTGASSYLLHPGPYRIEVTVGQYTRKYSSQSIGSAGPLHLPAQIFLNQAMGTGLVISPGSSLASGAVTSAGAARTVVVDSFAAVVQGIPIWNDLARTITISANATGATRIDTIVLEVVPTGNATEGKCTLKVVDGTAVQPVLTQTTLLWQFPLANVSVANGAATIAQANITDRRDYIERAVTTVETDVILLDARLDAIEAAPRVAFVGYYQGSYNPAAMVSNGQATVTVPITFKTGYTAITAADIFIAGHNGADAHAGVLNTVVNYITTTTVRYSIFNTWSATIDPVVADLTILVYRLVIS